MIYEIDIYIYTKRYESPGFSRSTNLTYSSLSFLALIKVMIRRLARDAGNAEDLRLGEEKSWENHGKIHGENPKIHHLSSWDDGKSADMKMEKSHWKFITCMMKWRFIDVKINVVDFPARPCWVRVMTPHQKALSIRILIYNMYIIYHHILYHHIIEELHDDSP